MPNSSEEEPADHADQTDRKNPLKRLLIRIIRVIRGLFFIVPGRAKRQVKLIGNSRQEAGGGRQSSNFLPPASGFLLPINANVTAPISS